MKIDVDDACSRNYPAKIEVEQLDTVKKLLIYAWEHEVCHITKLRQDQQAKVNSAILLAALGTYRTMNVYKDHTEQLLATRYKTAEVHNCGVNRISYQ